MKKKFFFFFIFFTTHLFALTPSEEKLANIINTEVKSLDIVNIDPINKGPYLLETLKVDKNSNKTEALNDIYKVLRPGEAPSTEIAEEIFNYLYFKKERYDLSEVGRVKLNSKLNLKVNSKKTILSTEDIVEIINLILSGNPAQYYKNSRFLLRRYC